LERGHLLALLSGDDAAVVTPLALLLFWASRRRSCIRAELEGDLVLDGVNPFPGIWFPGLVTVGGLVSVVDPAMVAVALDRDHTGLNLLGPVLLEDQLDLLGDALEVPGRLDGH
jgi:hypothetical protein